MTDIIEFPLHKTSNNQPDADCVRKDEYGRPLLLFGMKYQFEGSPYGLQIWAYSEEDAKAKIMALRQSAEYVGQIMAMVPS